MMTMVLMAMLLMARVAVAVYTIDASAPGIEFLGYGVNPSAGTYRLLHDYPEPQRTEVLDYMFAPNVGASYHRIKVRVLCCCCMGWLLGGTESRLLTLFRYHAEIQRWKSGETAKGLTAQRHLICGSGGKRILHAGTPGGFSRKLKHAIQI